MRVYLVQHGDAVPKEVDPDRPLSDTGCVWRIANFTDPRSGQVSARRPRHYAPRHLLPRGRRPAGHVTRRRPKGRVALLTFGNPKAEVPATNGGVSMN